MALEFDAVVVGAGTAGSNAAYQLAKRGLSVALIERRPLNDGGAHWHNGVLDWQFERAGLHPAEPPERSPRVRRLHMFDPSGRRAFTLEDPPTVSANMSLLGHRLRTLAAEHGVRMFDHAKDMDVRLDGDRIVSVGLRAANAEPLTAEPASHRAAADHPAASEQLQIEATLFVDASGRHGALRKHSPQLSRWCPTVRGDELCSASDFRFGIADQIGAKRFLDRHGASPGETITSVGNAGGFSTISITVAEGLDQVSVLVGCLADGRYGTGPRMLEAVRRSNSWIGKPGSGGSGVIPLRRPYSRFTAPGLALVGDSACQVFPAHGSGIGFGLIAGRMLADAVTASDSAVDIGDETVLWNYQAQFQREFGGALAAYDGLRRMTTALGSNGVGTMLSSRLVTESMTRSGLN
ncbi:MAG: NAD(P)/FAD-dependent oxidoreductase, partial [Microthrixaceae bacterium]